LSTGSRVVATVKLGIGAEACAALWPDAGALQQAANATVAAMKGRF
jgi:hypothetical protein